MKKSVLLLFYICLNFNSLLSEEAASPVRTVSDTIRFAHFEYVFDATQLLTAYNEHKINTQYSYSYLDSIYNNSFIPNWEFECIEEKVGYYVAHLLMKNSWDSEICLYFFEKSKFRADSVLSLLGFNDNIRYCDISVDTLHSVFQDKNYQYKYQELDMPLPPEKIPDSIKQEINLRIAVEIEKEREFKLNNKKIGTKKFRTSYSDYYVFNGKKYSYTEFDKYVIYRYNPLRNKEFFRALNIRQDKRFIIISELKSYKSDEFNANIPHYKGICESLLLNSENYTIDSSYYEKYSNRLFSFYNNCLFFEAYQTCDTNAYKYMLDKLAEKSVPHDSTLFELKPDWEKEIYKIFSDIFKTESYYCLIDNSLDIVIVDSIIFEKTIEKVKIREENGEVKNKDWVHYSYSIGDTINNITIHDFKPQINNKKIIYLDKYFPNSATNFLVFDFNYRNILEMPDIQEEIRDIRRSFWEKYLELNLWNWDFSPDWSIYTPPQFRFTINYELNQCVVMDFDKIMGFYTLLKKENGKWNKIPLSRYE